ncbi:MAG: TCR/Tet family MFS transporter [Rhodobacteraceae bacterium]|nr:TCR/Tet family MFS transporter [Paracoccaceae bacterium]
MLTRSRAGSRSERAQSGTRSRDGRKSRSKFREHRLPLIFVLSTVAIDAIGIGIIVPVMPDLILEVGGGTLGSAAVWGGILASVFAVMQLLCGPTIGNLSDRYGRRPVLLISLFFMGVDYLVMGVAHTIWLLLIGRIVGGITASTQPTVAAYVADISDPDEKAQNFGLIGAAFGVGFVLGPLFGAAFAELGTRAPFYAAAAFSFANMVFGWLVLPETVTDKIRRPFDWKRANPLGGLIYIGRLPGLKLLLLILFFFQIAFTVYPAIWSFYTLERFGWEPRMIGISLAAYGVAIAFVQGWFIRVVLRYMSEKQAVLFGFVFEIVGFVGYGFITETWQAFVLIPLSSLGAVAFPALQGIMSRIAFDNQQGELQGVMTGVVSLALIVSPLVMTLIFREFVEAGAPVYLPGAPFLLASILTVLCFGLMCMTPERRVAP